MTTWLRVCFVITMLVACGNKGNGNGVDAPGTGSDGGGSGSDGGGPGSDGGAGACTPGATQCSNCVDDDGDGQIDGFDIECTGPGDNDEATFATGIPGDNKDRVNQDCFFDGDSGAGNDGCNIHVCCLLGAATQADCPIGANQYDPTQCPPPIGSGTLSPMCIDTCGKATPPGCDCFGCCTLCDPVKGCFDVNINQAVSPDCTTDVLDDPTKCLTCTKSTVCDGGACGGETCVLCAGQDPTDLPASCMGATCPNGETKCAGDGDCSATEFCSNGCCVGVIL